MSTEDLGNLAMNLRHLRLARGWSQEQLAELAGLNIRTIQRVERGQNAGLETLKALAAVFETSVNQLKEQPAMSSNSQALPDTNPGQEQVTNKEPQGDPANNREAQIARFKIKFIRYLMVVAMLFAINLLSSPQYIWAWWPALGWGIALALGWGDEFLLEPLKAKAKKED